MSLLMHGGEHHEIGDGGWAESTESIDFINDRNVNGKAPNWSLIYFYALLALACLYGSNFGV